MARRRLIYEDTHHILFWGPETGTLVQYFKDEEDSQNRGNVSLTGGKAALSNRVSEFLHLRLGSGGFPTWFIRRLNMREQLLLDLEMIPLELVVRRIVDQDLAARYDLETGSRLPHGLLEYFYLNKKGARSPVTEEQIYLLNWVPLHELEEMSALALRSFDFLSGLFGGHNLSLHKMNFQFGRAWEGEEARIFLAASFSLDTFEASEILLPVSSGSKSIFRRTSIPEREEGTGMRSILHWRDIAQRLGILI